MTKTERKVGTVSRGIRCPIIREGDDLAAIVSTSVLEAAEAENFEIHDKDVISITESIVARAQGNYASIDDIQAIRFNQITNYKLIIIACLNICHKNLMRSKSTYKLHLIGKNICFMLIAQFIVDHAPYRGVSGTRHERHNLNSVLPIKDVIHTISAADFYRIDLI